MFKNKIFLLSAVFILTAFLCGCGARSVKRLETEKVVDISGRWNDTDSRLVSEEMIKDCLARPWINKFDEKNKKEPVVIVGTIVNRSHEHIDSQLFTKDLEKAFINSAQVKIVASKQEREEVREERTAQQEGLTDEQTIKEFGKETGADFMLEGSINSVKDEIKGKYVILYQVNLELIDLTNNQKTWIGQRKIKKYVKKSKFSL
ncbi:MAG: penicillin-binding protein activator LpoB [Candidatus Omnitrophica bacterium]|nr:penicillin-binding protein activator LpoB [Candidatus Omnitrophota bacterium]